ncbi:hypothetical protein SKAU_G00024210 [Synaphobranchus kaupii]|uniref:Uncharacterized protein n=1 Tax=Synaphobranchus kaupii TaxID=118154 RepID=A0A9Q1JDF3_SYNKA|nr:hypothetical protein SKAU_G00024210 [Synaphobranchus kaupii]
MSLMLSHDAVHTSALTQRLSLTPCHMRAQGGCGDHSTGRSALPSLNRKIVFTAASTVEAPAYSGGTGGYPLSVTSSHSPCPGCQLQFECGVRAHVGSAGLILQGLS